MLSHAIKIHSGNANLREIILQMNDSQQGSMNLFCIPEENDLQKGILFKLHRKRMTVNIVLQKYLDGPKRSSRNLRLELNRIRNE